MTAARVFMKTIFIDIDGTIFKQKENLSDIYRERLVLLPGVKEAFDSWNWKGYKIVITTGRKESTRYATETALRRAGLFWDHLLMGLDAGGERILINDHNPFVDDQTSAKSFEVARNEGLSQDIIDI
tara:strand:+ start:2215 stop:2595 length:381 start_codon:yes stop_codon:yes gene_type:complete